MVLNHVRYQVSGDCRARQFRAKPNRLVCQPALRRAYRARPDESARSRAGFRLAVLFDASNHAAWQIHFPTGCRAIAKTQAGKRRLEVPVTHQSRPGKPSEFINRKPPGCAWRFVCAESSQGLLVSLALCHDAKDQCQQVQMLVVGVRAEASTVQWQRFSAISFVTSRSASAPRAPSPTQRTRRTDTRIDRVPRHCRAIGRAKAVTPG